jgi:hypothetical protein
MRACSIPVFQPRKVAYSKKDHDEAGDVKIGREYHDTW